MKVIVINRCAYLMLSIRQNEGASAGSTTGLGNEGVMGVRMFRRVRKLEDRKKKQLEIINRRN